MTEPWSRSTVKATAGKRLSFVLLGALLVIFFNSFRAVGQVSGYSFSQLITPYTPLTGTPTVALAAPWDSQVNPVVPIGFSFVFDGIAYTDCRINANGYITFGATASAGNNVVPISSSTAFSGAISAFGSDLVSNATDGIVYQTTGAAPNRIFTVQWTNAQRSGDFAGGFNFQIRLLETSNIIEFAYGLCTTPNATLRTVQVGLRGPSNNFLQGNVNNRLQSTNLEWFNNTTPGTANSSSLRSTNAAYPDLGLLYRWTPPPACVTPPAQPTALLLGSTAINSTTFTGNSFTAAVPAATNYLVLRSLVNIPPTAADLPNRTFPAAVNGTMGAGVYTVISNTSATTFTQTGLTPETTYYYWVISYNINCLGAPFYNLTNILSGNATTCTPASVAAPASSIGGNSFTANWSAVATATNYRLDVATDAAFTAILPAYNNLLVGNVTSYIVTGLLPLTTYYYRVRAIGSSCALNSNTTTVSTLCGFYNIPYTQNFDAATVAIGGIAPCFTRNNVNADAFQWGVQTITYASAPKSMLLSTVASIPADDWFFLPGLNLTGGISYRLFFRYRTNSAGAEAEILKAFLGSGADPTLMTQTLIDLTNINNTLFRTAFVDFTPVSSGIYYIGFEGSSMALQTYIAVDDISVTVAPTCLDPTEVTATSVGTTTASFSWVAPLPEPANGYQYYISTSATPPTAATVPTGSAPFGSTSVTVSGLLPSTTYYIWFRGNCSATDKSVWTVEETFSTECITPSINSVTGATRCGPGTVNLTATATIGSSIQWYSQATDGSILATGGTFTTPALSTSTTYYAEAKSLGAIARCGPQSPAIVGGVVGVQNYTASVNFTVFSPTRLLSIDVFPVASGQPASIQVRNSSNLNLQTITFTTAGSGGSTPQVVPINYTFEPGVYNLFLSAAPTSGLAINTTNAVYPYTSSVAEITGNIVSSSQFLSFYNWKFTTECLSTRVPVTATVNAPPALSLSSSGDTICSGFSTPVVTVTGASAYNTLTWSPNTFVSGSAAAGYTFNPPATTTYTLTGAQTSGSFCTNFATYTVTVNPSPPAVSVIPAAPVTLCQGSVQALNGSIGSLVTVQIYSQNFNGATNDWTVANTSTDGSVANSQWTLRNSTYLYSSSTWNVSLRSNDNSKFYFANADAQGSSLLPFAVTRTTLTSPVFDLTGYSSANLNFYHYLRYILDDTFFVEASTDNGATWTLVRQYLGSQGTPLNFANANIDLSAYAGSSSLRVRFNLTSYWGYGWAIDNVTLTGSIASALQWTPATDLYTDSAATIPYVEGTFATVVYAKPSASTVYTATALNANGCSSSDTATINIDAAPIGGILSANQTICSGIPTNITLSGHSGNILRWQYADDAAFTVNVTNITNTATTLTPAQMGVITNVRYFRAVISNGVCTPVYSTVSSVSYPTTTWDGVAWTNGTPAAGVKAILNGDFTVSSDFYACALQINAGTVTVNAGVTMVIENEVNVAGSALLVFENSASLKQINNTVNTGNITYKRNTTPVRKFDYTYWSSPVAGQTITALSPNTNPGTSYVWNTPVNNWTGVPGSTVMTAGKGYIVRAPDIAPFNTATPNVFNATLVGVPHNGDIVAPITVSGTARLNLIGNPYPSSINIDSFFLDPTNVPLVDATIYLWTHNTPITNNVYTSNDYAVYNLLGGVGTSSAVNAGVNNNIPTGKVAAGQSFFINGLTTGNAIFKNSLREIGLNSQFYRLNGALENTQDKNRIWLEMTNSQGAYKQILVGYTAGATLALDRGFDGAFVDGGNVIGFYSMAGDKLSIQGRPMPFDPLDQVIVGYSSAIEGNFSIGLAGFDGLFENQGIYLEDKLLNVIHDLKNGPYTFATNVGTYDDRFLLRYTGGQLQTIDFSADEVIIYKNNDQWVINTGDDLMSDVRIFDLRGRLLLHQSDLNTTETQIQVNTASQVLLVSVTMSDGTTIFKKIIN